MVKGFSGAIPRDISLKLARVLRRTRTLKKIF
jgi:hypothetical protein